jgi:hypothetical protein
MTPVTLALVYAASALIIPIGFKVFKTPFDWIDIALASVGALSGRILTSSQNAQSHRSPSKLAVTRNCYLWI